MLKLFWFLATFTYLFLNEFYSIFVSQSPNHSTSHDFTRIAERRLPHQKTNTELANFLFWSNFFENLALWIGDIVMQQSYSQRSIEYSKAAIWKPSFLSKHGQSGMNTNLHGLFIHISKSSNLSLYLRVRELSGMLTKMKRQWQRAFI